MRQFVSVLCFIAVPSLAAANTVSVMPVDATNLSPGEANAIAVMIANAYSSLGSTVISPKDTAAALANAGDSLAAVAALGADEYIETSAVRLSEKIKIRSVLRDSHGSQLHAASLTAQSLDDVEPVADRVAKSLLDRTDTSSVMTRHNVTATEAKQARRLWTERVWGLKSSLGTAAAAGEEFDATVSYGFDWRFEADRFFLEFGFGCMLPTTAMEGTSIGGLYSEIGGSYYLTSGDIAPYAGAGIMPRIVATGYDGKFEIAPYGQLGVMFFRQMSTRIYTDLRIAQNLLPYKRLGGKKIYPTELALNVGIGW